MNKSILSAVAPLAILFCLPAIAAPPPACGDLVAGDVTLYSDLHCTVGTGGWGSPVLGVVADGVTIDLNGHTLSGSGGLDGIGVDGRSGVTIKNGVIKGFKVGVSSTGSKGLEVRGVTFYETKAGLLLGSASKAHVVDSQFVRITERAVEISNYLAGRNARENIIENNEFYQVLVGVTICGLGTADNLVRGNLIWQSGWFGILLDHSVGNRLQDNKILDTGGTAIRMDNSEYNQVTRNTLEGGETGLQINAGNLPGGCLSSGRTASRFNTFKENYARKFLIGASLDGTGKGSVYKNELRGNKLYDDGMGLYFGAQTQHNDATGNGYQGTTTPVVDFGVANTY